MNVSALFVQIVLKFQLFYHEEIFAYNRNLIFIFFWLITRDESRQSLRS